MTEPRENKRHLDAQMGVIGSLLLDAETCAGEVFLRTQEDQYTGEYKTLFVAAKRLHQEGRPIDPVTVRGIVGEEYTAMLLQVMELTPTASNCSAYVDLLIEQAQVAKMQALGLALAGCQSTEEAKGLIEQANQAVVQRSALRVVSAREGYLKFISRQDRKAEYIPWGFPKLSETVLSSLGDLVILGGRPSAGKTALSLQMAWEQAETRKVGYFSFETNPDEVFDRLNAMSAGVDSTRIRLRKLQEPDRQKLIAAGQEFERRKLDVIHANGMTVADVRSVVVARGYQVVYLDYLQIINPGREVSRGDRFGGVSIISMDLHNMAVSLGVLVVALSQLSRPDKAARNKAPDLYSLRESGQIEQDADAVFLLYKTDEEEKNPPRNLRIAKNKKGFAGGYIEMDFDGATQTFREKAEKSSVSSHYIAEGRAAKQRARGKPQAGELEELTGPDKDLPF